MNKELNATHFVRSVTLGAVVKADMKVMSNEEKTEIDLKGNVLANILGKLSFGQINASVKASLSYLDHKLSDDYSLEITVHSRPSMNIEPTTIEQMFKMIENMNSVVNDHKYYPKLGEKIIGIPIRFHLVPIKQFLEFKVERLYLKLSDKILNDFTKMMTTIIDIQTTDYLLKNILKLNPSFGSCIK